MNKHRSGTAIAAALSFVLATTALSPAFAQSQADLAGARKKFESALELEKKGDWKAALPLLRDVAAVKATSQVYFHIALCLERTGHLVEARDVYAKSKAEAETKEGAEGVTMQKKATERLADLDARIPKIEFTVPDDVVAAKLTIDGGAPIAILVTPVVSFDAGEHQLVVRSPGRKTWKQKVVLKERDPQQKIAVTLPEDPNAAAGDKDETKEAKDDDQTGVPPPPAPKPRRDEVPNGVDLPWPWVVGAVGVASLATAGVMYGLRASTVSDMDAACGPNRDHCPKSLQATEDKGRTYTTAGNVFVVIGVVAVGSAIGLFVIDKKSKTKVGAAATPNSFAVGVSGHF